MRLLRVKLRSEAEIRERLAAAGFDETNVEAVVGELKKARIIDDAALAEAEVRRMKERGASGVKAVREKLKKRGLKVGMDVGDLASTRAEVLAFAKKKLAAMPATLGGDTKARRLFGVLARRGIDEDVASEVVVELTGVARDEA